MRIILQTPRLVLREFTEGDADNLFDLNSDPEVMRYLTGGRPTPWEVIRYEIIPFHLDVYERLDRLGTWAAESSSTGEFLGWFHFAPAQTAMSRTSTSACSACSDTPWLSIPHPGSSTRSPGPSGRLPQLAIVMMVLTRASALVRL